MFNSGDAGLKYHFPLPMNFNSVPDVESQTVGKFFKGFIRNDHNAPAWDLKQIHNLETVHRANDLILYSSFPGLDSNSADFRPPTSPPPTTPQGVAVLVKLKGSFIGHGRKCRE